MRYIPTCQLNPARITKNYPRIKPKMLPMFVLVDQIPKSKAYFLLSNWEFMSISKLGQAKLWKYPSIHIKTQRMAKQPETQALRATGTRAKNIAVRSKPIARANTGLGNGNIACCRNPKARAYSMSESTIPVYFEIYLALPNQPSPCSRSFPWKRNK